jgi:enolase-phosphatase E1
MDNIKHFIFDIEGTVAPISFVFNILFPYSQKKLYSYLNQNPIDDHLFFQLSKEHSVDFKQNQFTLNLNKTSESIYNYLNYLISIDRKSTALKEIQGKIWKEGYENGDIKSILYEDTIKYFQFLISQDKSISIYSSGSILAQKLIFKYSNLGDLTNFISNYFDTGIGNKRDPQSYLNIAKELNSHTKNLCFFTDIKEEAIASKETNMIVYLLNRPENKPQNYFEVPNIENFNNLIINVGKY